MVATPFFGPAYVSRSRNLVDQRLINLYPELVETKGGKNVGAFYGCPGLDLLCTIGKGPVQAFCMFQGLLYAVSGGQLYSIDANWNVINIGAITPPAILYTTEGGTNPLVALSWSSGVVMAQTTNPIDGYIAVGGNFTITGASPDGYNGGFTAITGSGGTTLMWDLATDPGSAVTLGNLLFPSGVLPLTLPFSMTAPTTFYTMAAIEDQLAIFCNITSTVVDDFGVINQPGTNQLWASNELDLSSWNGLSFASASGDPDNIVCVQQVHREVFVIKELETEVWVNAGLPTFPFARLDGTYLEVGTIAPLSICKVNESLMWLARNSQGENVVVQLRGYEPAPVSTHYITREIDEYPIVSDAIGFSYQQEGHTFYVLIFPTGDATWVYDATESQAAGIPMWHQRASFANGKFARHWANCGVNFNGRQVVGDYQNGNLYAFDLDALTDNGAQRKWLRSWRALPQPSFVPVRFSQLQIDMQTGIGVPDGTTPQMMLRWSDDGGHNWSNGLIEAAGAPGKTAQRVIARRLGSTRRDSGLDRTFELSATDQFPVALIGAELT